MIRVKKITIHCDILLNEDQLKQVKKDIEDQLNLEPSNFELICNYETIPTKKQIVDHG